MAASRRHCLEAPGLSGAAISAYDRALGAVLNETSSSERGFPVTASGVYQRRGALRRARGRAQRDCNDCSRCLRRYDS